MTRDAIQSLLVRRDELWRRRDAAALAATHADDGVVVSPMFGEVRGREAIERSYRELFTVFPDQTLETESVLVDGDAAALVFRGHATHSRELFGVPPSGRRFEVHGVMFFKFADGRVAFERRIYDFTSLLIQVGILRAKPGR
jgi:steroid delta-isomerase-like uncharacterized protein